MNMMSGFNVSPHMNMSPGSNRSPAYLQKRVPLGELPINYESESSDPVKAFIERERAQRQQIERTELTESARLEMNVQNLNIKKNGQQYGLPSTPTHNREQSQCPATCERAENADGSIRYEFNNNLPGGLCVYFMKGYCGLGSKCRYVHDSEDPGTMVKVTGMPYTSTAEQVISFFSPIQLKPSSIRFLMSKEGRQTGTCFVEFESRKDALLALGKDRSFFNEHRFVLLYASSKIEREWYTNNLLPFGQHTTPQMKRKGQHQRQVGTPPSYAPPSQLLALQAQQLGFGMPCPTPPSRAQPPMSPFVANQMAAALASSPAMMSHAQFAASIGYNQAAAALSGLQLATPPMMNRTFDDPLIGAGAGEVTPAKQLQFDEALDSAVEQVAQTQMADINDLGQADSGSALLTDLSTKFSNPFDVLSGLPEDNLKVVLKSMGYRDEACTSLMQELYRGAPAQQSMPPLVPMTKIA
eukprot:TRINITY_DN6899_c2_g1_i1.p1 TRINITY_DN6899_c2_g1~~TRINITY_DN6899_c2_g1_i1.p1  ORF type:complete len:469 (+),score=108.62 TRINITY_DN6899_c2_g1_i1:64-1470(+)